MNGYGIYLAEITGMCNMRKDPRAQVRVLPNMRDISDDLCPMWPAFFADEILAAPAKTLVWCICSDDFSTGYILGPANRNAYMENPSFRNIVNPQTEKISKWLTPPSKENKDDEPEMLDTISETYKTLTGYTLNYLNVKVTFWNEASIHLIDLDTGASIKGFKNGTMFIETPDAFAMKIGAATFKMDSSGVSMTSETTRIQSDQINLGKAATRAVLLSSGTDEGTAIASDIVKA